MLRRKELCLVAADVETTSGFSAEPSSFIPSYDFGPLNHAVPASHEKPYLGFGAIEASLRGPSLYGQQPLQESKNVFPPPLPQQTQAQPTIGWNLPAVAPPNNFNGYPQPTYPAQSSQPSQYGAPMYPSLYSQGPAYGAPYESSYYPQSTDFNGQYSAERQKGIENEGRGDTEASFFQMKTLEEGLDRLSRTIASVPLPKQFEQLPKRLNQLTGAIKTLSKGGKGNTLSKLGKIILSRALKKQFKRKVPTFVSPLRASRPMAVTDFETTRAQCLEMRVFFEDPDFPAENSSISFSRAPPRRVIWKRPFEIVKEPCFIVDGHSRFDVIQGDLGDCWLLVGIANLTLRDELFYRVVPPDQGFTDAYAGIFHFQLWRYGRWVDVIVDDRLPTVDGRLLYMKSSEHSEFWSALLEKAFAKLHGSYEALKGGTMAEALEDLTGGLCEHFSLRKMTREQIFSLIVRGFETGSLFGCCIEGSDIREQAMSNGLFRGHAYSISAMHTMELPRGRTTIVRIRNPWGNDKEWKGAWSDTSIEWSRVPSNVKQQLQFVAADNGEFWMSFEDFCSNFEMLEVCNLSNGTVNEIAQMVGEQRIARAWYESQADGRWSLSDGTAGGCCNNLDTFPNNPQIALTVSPQGQPADADGKCTVIIALLQKYRRELRCKGLDVLPIGFDVYEASGYGRLERSFLQRVMPFTETPVHTNKRAVSLRVRVRPGTYVIVPSTFYQRQEADFLVRVFASDPVTLRELR